MKKKIKYTDEPMGKIKRMEDIFPKSEELVFKEGKTEITITLSNNSFTFFLREAKKANTQYEMLISNLLEDYVLRYNR